MSSGSLLEVKIEHRVGALALAFELTQPWTVLFGPSGSGKTTVLRAIAGFVRPEAGRISAGGKVLVDGAAGVFVPAHERPVRSAGQSARLFPHMTIRRNLMFGAERDADPGRAAELAERMMTLFRIEHLSGRMPRELSGGERQRAAVARAVVSAKSYPGSAKALLLLDEPFTGLDGTVRDELLLKLRAWVGREGIPVLSVTHDVGEAFLLQAEVIRIGEGKVVAQGPVSEVLAEERLQVMERLNI